MIWEVECGGLVQKFADRKEAVGYARGIAASSGKRSSVRKGRDLWDLYVIDLQTRRTSLIVDRIAQDKALKVLAIWDTKSIEAVCVMWPTGLPSPASYFC